MRLVRLDQALPPPKQQPLQQQPPHLSLKKQQRLHRLILRNQQAQIRGLKLRVAMMLLHCIWQVFLPCQKCLANQTKQQALFLQKQMKLELFTKEQSLAKRQMEENIHIPLLMILNKTKFFIQQAVLHKMKKEM